MPAPPSPCAPNPRRCPTVLITRPAGRADGLRSRLAGAGLRVIEAPVIRTEPLPLGPRGRRILESLDGFDAVLFTSANAVRFFGRLAPRLRPPAYVIGPATAEAAKKAGHRVLRQARAHRAEGLAAVFPKTLAGRRYLLPRAREAREVLPGSLRRRGARVTVWPLYRTRPLALSAACRRRVLGGGVDVVAFASGSAVRSFLANFSKSERREIFRRVRAAAIGPVTAGALRRAGISPALTARRATARDLARRILAWRRGVP